MNNTDANVLRRHMESMKGHKRRIYGVPSETMEILRRWRETRARQMPRWEVTTVFTKGDVHG